MLACVSFPAWFVGVIYLFFTAAVGSLFGPLVVHRGRGGIATLLARLCAAVMLVACAIGWGSGAPHVVIGSILFGLVQVATLMPRRRAPRVAPVEPVTF